jgi:hypothetical protein
MGTAMKSRSILSLWAVLALAGSTLGQTPPENAAPLTPTPADYLPPEGEVQALNFTPFSRRFYVEAEGLLWWVKGPSLPPLVTTAPADTPQALAGLNGVPSTTVLYGGRTGDELFPGGRLTIGVADNMLGFDRVVLQLFGLGGTQSRFHVDSSQYDVIARPFYIPSEGTEAAQLTSYPGLSTGSVDITTQQFVFGTELNVLPNMVNYTATGGPRFDFIAGMRYLQFNEQLKSREGLEVTSGPFVPGTRLSLNEDFDARNSFVGAQLGFLSTWTKGRLSMELLTKLALGGVYEGFRVSGNTLVAVPGQDIVNNPGAIYANETNLGRDSKQLGFGVVPELGLKLGAQITDNWRLTVGYSFLYLSSAVRPQNLISTNFNPDILPPSDPAGLKRNSRTFGESDVWLQGVNFGAEFSY